MSKVLEETGLLLSPSEYNKWRPTKRQPGTISGLAVGVVCVATDGNLGIFLPRVATGHSLGAAFLGHVHRFEWLSGENIDGEQVFRVGSPPVLFSESKSATFKPKKKRITKAEAIARLLED